MMMNLGDAVMGGLVVIVFTVGLWLPRHGHP